MNLGVVFAAKHIECRRSSEKQRVMDEIEILGRLRHKTVVRLYKVYCDEEKDHIVEIFEYLAGGELFGRILQADTIITETDIAGFIYQILTGVKYF